MSNKECTRRTALGWLSLTSMSAVMQACEVVSPDLIATQLKLPPSQTSHTVLKQRARHDYQSSLVAYGGRLAQSSASIASRYDVVIIGSGYGAAAVAAELTPKLRHGCTLAILERGKEWLPGDFPDTFTDFGEQVTSRDKLGLYDMTEHDDLFVLAGSALGGTSLINANVAMEPEDSVFERHPWPTSLTKATLAPYYRKARHILNAQSSPHNRSPKMNVQQQVATVKGALYTNLDLTINRTKGQDFVINKQGMRQRGCTDCGDCITGCNVGAKNTLTYNYLPLAKKHGAHIFCEIEVTHLQKLSDGYLVHYIRRAPKRNAWRIIDNTYQEIPGHLYAKVVVLGAGTLGSTGILLRSQKSGLPLSSTVGQRFSGNGDYISFTNKAPLEKDHTIGGFGAHPISDHSHQAAGPSIQSAVHYDIKGQRFLVQDLAIPRALVPLVDTLTSGVRKSMLYLGMGDDGSQGKIVLDAEGRPIVKWPGMMRFPCYEAIKDIMVQQAETLGGDGDFRPRFVNRMAGDRGTTAHPLGGCVMADSGSTGVVNDCGNVFSGDGTDCHNGLYIADGSIIATPLGCNPFLTITALATHIAHQILAENKFAELFHS